MLEVLAGSPGAAPLESVLDEKAAAEVVLVDSVGEGTGAVAVGFACGWLHEEGAVLAAFVVGIVEGVDVNGHAPCMVGQHLRSRHHAIAEAGGVVVAHRPLVVGIVLVDEHHALDGVLVLVELAVYFHQVLRNGFVAHHFAYMDGSVEVIVQGANVAQVGEGNGAALGIGLPLHAGKHSVADRFGTEATVESILADCLLADFGTGSPLAQRLRL